MTTTPSTEELTETLPSDYGNIKRFELAEQLWGVGKDVGRIPLHETHPLIQHYWLKVADKAIAILIENPQRHE